MLLYIIVLVLYPFLQKKIIDEPISQDIQNAKNSKEAIFYRKKLSLYRVLFLLFYFAVISTLIGIIAFVSDDSDNAFFIASIKCAGLFIYLVLRYLTDTSKGRGKLLGNISTMDKATFLARKKEYALYLRSFESDIYDDNRLINKDGFHFIEYQFMSILQTKRTVCAVGMTKEIDAPLGASRVYLDDANWKDGVIDLIESAKEIYILVSSRESCIWEIYQCINCLDRTVFIVDSLQEYNKILKSMDNHLNFPEILEKNSQEIIALTYINEQWEYHSYEKSPAGYAKMLNVPIPKMKSFRVYIKNPEV